MHTKTRLTVLKMLHHYNSEVQVAHFGTYLRPSLLYLPNSTTSNHFLTRPARFLKNPFKCSYSLSSPLQPRTLILFSPWHKAVLRTHATAGPPLLWFLPTQYKICRTFLHCINSTGVIEVFIFFREKTFLYSTPLGLIRLGQVLRALRTSQL